MARKKLGDPPKKLLTNQNCLKWRELLLKNPGGGEFRVLACADMGSEDPPCRAPVFLHAVTGVYSSRIRRQGGDSNFIIYLF
jgi:hypothetical protein